MDRQMEVNMAAVIASRNYTYGAGSTHNRQIQFSKTLSGAFQAKVYVLQAGGALGALTSTVSGDNISVEVESTSTKLIAFRARRTLAPNLLLSKLTETQQKALMSSLASRGIEVMNGIGKPGGLEVVQRLNIFDPR
jgi:hypothetical protein